jgi:hypothetical protein
VLFVLVAAEILCKPLPEDDVFQWPDTVFFSALPFVRKSKIAFYMHNAMDIVTQ